MQRVVIIALTSTGANTARKLAHRLKNNQQAADICLSQRLAQKNEESYGKGQFISTFHQLFKDYDCVICIMATGIVVRVLTGVIVDKTVDPAVLVMDEKAKHVISLLSGHIGGANDWTHLVAKLMKADPVITTATDTEHVQALDMMAKHLNGWYPNLKENTKYFNSLLAEKKPVEIYIESYLKKYVGALTGFTILDQIQQHQAGVPLVVVSDHTDFPKNKDMLQLVPRLNVLGVGCRRGVTDEMIQQAFSEFCQEHHLLWQSIKEIVSIDVKSREGALQYLAKTLGTDLKFFSAEELKEASSHYPSSPFVLKTVGVGNVACAAADFASGERTVTKRYANHEITMALGRMNKI